MNNQLTTKRNNSLTEFVFFGNYFYGLCAVALSIEVTLQQHFPLDSPGLGLLSFIYYAQSHHFNPVKILLNTIPFILLIAAAFSLRKRRFLLYYLIVIDGLMLVKAICGSIAMTWF